MDNLPVVSCKYLCEMWSYLGGGVHFAFTWSVIPVIVVVIYDGAALFCSHCLWWVVYDKVPLLPNCTWRGGRVSCVLVTMSFEVVVPVGVSLDV